MRTRTWPGAQVRVRVDIFNAAAAMLRTGVGIGVLPTFMQARHPGAGARCLK
jgi:DNA-binding transcriptional LysR family regulator